MSSDSNRGWLKFKRGTEIRSDAALLTDVFAERIGYVFAHWLAERLSTTPDKLVLAVGRDSRHSGPRLKDALIREGFSATVMTAIPMSPFAECYDAELAKRYLSEGKIVILGAGLGMPFVSTDTAGAVRAAEIGADAMLMAKNIDYIYTADPRKDPNAKKLPTVSCSQILEWGLAAIDATAAAFCRSVGLPVRMFGMNEPMDIFAAVKGEKPGTVVTPD